MLSTVATTSIEDAIAARGAPVWFQLYPTRKWEVAEALVRRAERAGSPVIVVTVDGPAPVNWETLVRLHTVQVSAKVAGRVKAVLVDDNQEVRADQPLIELDPADFQTALSQAVANQESAQGQLAQAKAQVPVAQANLDQARAQVAVAQAAATNADINLKRDQTLERMGGLAVSHQQLDNDTATARSDAANL